ncbi:hypothetical protein DH86_00001101, partial [Scytalidium sp. 3C]
MHHYVDQQTYVAELSGGRATVHNDDFIGIASYNIFVGIAVATIFGAAFFFDLFWPERYESTAVRLAWKICSLVVSIMALADVLALTVIVASHSAYITGVSATEAERLRTTISYPPYPYRKNPKCVASAVILWPGMIASFASTYLMWTSQIHDDSHGPWSDEYNQKRQQERKERNMNTDGVDGMNGIHGMNGINHVNGTNGANGINHMGGINGMSDIHGVNGING